MKEKQEPLDISDLLIETRLCGSSPQDPRIMPDQSTEARFQDLRKEVRPGGKLLSKPFQSTTVFCTSGGGQVIERKGRTREGSHKVGRALASA
jgi:hypothetical protein